MSIIHKLIIVAFIYIFICLNAMDLYFRNAYL